MVDITKGAGVGADGLDETEPAQCADTGAKPDAGSTGAKPDAYASIIEQQQEQIRALMDANAAMSKQITGLIQSGAQIGSPAQGADAGVSSESGVAGSLRTPSLDADVSLESLAKEIGKHDAR